MLHHLYLIVKQLAQNIPMNTQLVLDLFKTPNMLKKTLIICGCWFANSVVYYGVSLNAGKLNGNPYFIVFLMGIVEMPAYVVILYFLDRVGHRALISAMMLLGGISCLWWLHCHTALHLLWVS